MTFFRLYVHRKAAPVRCGAVRKVVVQVDSETRGGAPLAPQRAGRRVLSQAHQASGSRVGLYALYGEAATEASSWATEGEPFFLGRGGCNRPWSALGGDASAVAVPWVDGQDPINGSKLPVGPQRELYLDPTLELQLSFAAGNFYICRGGGCVCQVTGYETTEWKMLARLAMAMPSVPMASKLLELQGTLSRRCPDAGALDLAMLCWTAPWSAALVELGHGVLMLLFFAICIEASLVLWCAGATAEPTTAGDGKMPSSLEEDAAMKIVAGLNGAHGDAPLQIFGTGSLVKVLRVDLGLHRLSDDAADGGAVPGEEVRHAGGSSVMISGPKPYVREPRLRQEVGKEKVEKTETHFDDFSGEQLLGFASHPPSQIPEAFLRQGICLTGPSGSTVLDALLFVALCIYALAVVLSVGSGVSLRVPLLGDPEQGEASALVSLALVSPAWTLVKALRNAQDSAEFVAMGIPHCHRHEFMDPRCLQLERQETEKKMDQLIFVSRVDRLSAKAPSLLTWHCLVSASRCGLDFREVHGTGDDVNQAAA
eukprot:Skav233981  [mRNA]  locus=scaffold1008:758507:771236:+ [translate_table: standard]